MEPPHRYFDPYRTPPRFWRDKAEEEREEAIAATTSPYHTAAALRRCAAARAEAQRYRETIADLLAQIEADQRELERYRALVDL
jgi:hypothetical protein